MNTYLVFRCFFSAARAGNSTRLGPASCSAACAGSSVDEPSFLTGYFAGFLTVYFAGGLASILQASCFFLEGHDHRCLQYRLQLSIVRGSSPSQASPLSSSLVGQTFGEVKVGSETPKGPSFSVRGNSQSGSPERDAKCDTKSRRNGGASLG